MEEKNIIDYLLKSCIVVEVGCLWSSGKSINRMNLF